MDEAVADIFETCLERLAAGATVEDCLVAYPAERATLEPLLRAATRLQALPRPAPLPAAAQAALATRVLNQVTNARSATTSVPRLAQTPASAPRPGPSALLAGVLRMLGYRGPLAQPWLRLGATALALVLAFALVATAYAAVRAIFSPSPDAPAALAPATSFALEGFIEAVSEAGLVVAGIAVDLGPQTVITGTPEVGAHAEVRGQIREDGTLLAEAVVVDTGVATGGSPTVSAIALPAASATGAPVAVATAASPPTAESVAPTTEPTVPPTVAPTAAPTPAPPPEPTAPPAAPVPSGDPLVQLRQLLEAGVATGRAGEQGREFLNKLSEAEQALAEGNSQKAGDQLRDLYQKLREQAREGKTDPAFAQEAQALITAIGEAYGLRTVPDEEGGGGESGGNGDDKEDKDDKKDE